MLTGYDKYLFLLRIDFEIWSYYGTQDNALMVLKRMAEADGYKIEDGDIYVGNLSGSRAICLEEIVKVG